MYWTHAGLSVVKFFDGNLILSNSYKVKHIWPGFGYSFMVRRSSKTFRNVRTAVAAVVAAVEVASSAVAIK